MISCFLPLNPSLPISSSAGASVSSTATPSAPGIVSLGVALLKILGCFGLRLLDQGGCFEAVFG